MRALIWAVVLIPRLQAAPVESVPFREGFLHSFVSFRPEAGTALGLAQFNGKLGIPTAANIAGQIAFLEGAQRRLESAGPPPAGSAEAIDRQVMLAIARAQLHELRDRRSYLTDVITAQGPYDVVSQQLAQLGQGPQAAREWADIVSRTEQVPEYLKAVRENLRQGLAAGRQTYRGFVEKDGIKAGGEAAAFFGEELLEKARASLPPPEFAALQPRLLAAAQAAGRAYRAQVDFLRAEILPRATEKYGVGAEEYGWKLKNELGITQSPSELQAKGLELARGIRDRMEALARKIDPSRPLPEIMASLREDHPRDDAEMLKTYREVSARARDFVVENKLFAIPADYAIDVIETPAGMRSHIGSAAYFPAPPLDLAKKGVFLVTPSAGQQRRLTIHNFSKIPTTVVHEAFPGHDMQFWSFQRSAGVSAVRHLLEHAGFAYSLNVEGYAHYAEELMRQRGFFSPKEELAQLGAQLWRAYRIALDAALHNGETTVQEVARVLTEQAFLPQAIAEVEAYRYLKMPTQALTYLLGRLQIEELKEEYRAAKGAAYGDAEFHRSFLNHGPVPPSMMREAMLAEARGPGGIRGFLTKPAAQVFSWAALAAAFNVGLYFHSGAQAAQEFLSAYVIEWTMSFDNMVVIAAALAAAPESARQNVLRIGLLGAILARMGLITAGIGLVASHESLFLVFGAFLLAVAAKMLNPAWDLVGLITRPAARLFQSSRLARGHQSLLKRVSWLGNPAVKVALTIIGVDIIFAMDSVPAALAISKNPMVIIAANAFSVMGLGALVSLLDWLEHKFVHLAKGVAAVLVFVGGKMIAEPLLGLHAGAALSLTVVVGVLGVAAVASLLSAKRRPEA